MISIAIEPMLVSEYVAAAESAGASVVPLSADVRALIWLDYSKPENLEKLLDENPQIEWVQLPFAGVDAFENLLGRPIRFTSAKGSYREPVAEHALALSLAMMRIIPERVIEKTWGRKFAASLYDSNVLIVGGGGIAEELLLLLRPFRAQVTVVRKKETPLPGAHKTVMFSQLESELPKADLVILAAALTSETKGLFNLQMFRLMKPTSYFINVARGPIVHTDDLVIALNDLMIAGAAVDVTDPEPLPDGHPLWSAKNVIVTPHSADTRVQVVRLFSDRIRVNVLAYQGMGQWTGLVDPELGY